MRNDKHFQPDCQPEKGSKLLAPGTKAPDFTLHVTADQSLALSDLAGKPVVMAFYPADWSPVCGDQMALYNEALPEFEKYDAEILGISVDGVWCHEAFAKQLHLHFPCWLISSRRERSPDAMAPIARVMASASEPFLCSTGKGSIFWNYLSPVAVNPGADGILHALEQLPG